MGQYSYHPFAGFLSFVATRSHRVLFERSNCQWRRLYPDRPQFTFWDYRQPDAMKANRGWRIDHILATKPLAQKCTAVEVDVNPRKGKSPSDHTVLWAKFSI